MSFYLHEGNREAYEAICGLASGEVLPGLFIVYGQILSGKSSLLQEAAESVLIGRTTGVMAAEEVLEELEFAESEQCNSFFRECADREFVLIDELAETNKEEERRFIAFLELMLDLGNIVILGVDAENLSPTLYLHLYEKNCVFLPVRHPNLRERAEYTASQLKGLTARYAPSDLAEIVAGKCIGLCEIDITLSYFELRMKYYIKTQDDHETAAKKAFAFFEHYEQDEPEPLPLVDELLQEEPRQSSTHPIFCWQSIGGFSETDCELDF